MYENVIYFSRTNNMPSEVIHFAIKSIEKQIGLKLITKNLIDKEPETEFYMNPYAMAMVHFVPNSKFTKTTNYLDQLTYKELDTALSLERPIMLAYYTLKQDHLTDDINLYKLSNFNKKKVSFGYKIEGKPNFYEIQEEQLSLLMNRKKYDF